MLAPQTGPMPSPKWALFGADLAWPQPSSQQTTLASGNPQPLSQTVPHWLLWKISTLPEQVLLVPTSLTELRIGVGVAGVVDAISA